MMSKVSRARRRTAPSIALCAAIVAAAACLLAPPTQATTLRRMSLKEMVQRSQKIVRGTISDMQSAVDDRSRLWTLYTISGAQVAKGRLTGSMRLRFRCMGGTLGDRAYRIPGTPELALGDDVVVFYAPDNQLCQIMGWMQGHFRALPTPSGQRNVFNYQDRPVVGVTTQALLLGERPPWLRRAQDGSRFVDPDTPRVEVGRADTLATPEDFMTDLGALSRFHEDLAPEDEPSEGTKDVIGTLPDLQAVTPPSFGAAP